MTSKVACLSKKILEKHVDLNTGSPEIILLGYCENEAASEHLSRYKLASQLACGIVLDCAAGSCYGSSILRRRDSVCLVVSVDIDKDLLLYGKIVYGADCIRADARNLPFKEECFDSIISVETLEHIDDQKRFLDAIKTCLKKDGSLILSTPNKLISSPFLPRPLNPFHQREYYLGSLLALLKSNGFRVVIAYKGRKVAPLELLRRILSSLLKLFLSKLEISPRLVDNIYGRLDKRRRRVTNAMVDPDPNLFSHAKLKATSNVILCQYFLIQACRAYALTC